MITKTPQECWSQFLECIADRCSATEYENWFASLRVLEGSNEELLLEVPNIFVQEYLLENYKKDLSAFLPTRANGQPAITFIIAASPKKPAFCSPPPPPPSATEATAVQGDFKLNPFYTFSHNLSGAIFCAFKLTSNCNARKKISSGFCFLSLTR